MNNAIHDAFVNALLADASYVEGLRPGDQNADLAGKLRLRLTQKLADYVGQNFTVISQMTETASGFSVTVFEDGSTGRRYISFRGTELGSLADLATDMNVVVGTGLAQSQIFAMINWYLRAITEPGVSVIQLYSTVHNDASGKVVNGTKGVRDEFFFQFQAHAVRQLS